jgi:hydrogenase nickel incorporation protein HypA/HybF
MGAIAENVAGAKHVVRKISGSIRLVRCRVRSRRLIRQEWLMHELAITQDIIDVVCEHAQGAKIRRIVLEIGKLSAVLPDAVRFCFELCAEGTVAEGAELEILEPSGLARCRVCNCHVTLDRPIGLCSCGSADLEWISGEELKINELEVA